MGAPTTKLETMIIISPLKALGLFSSLLAIVCLFVTMPTSFWVVAGSKNRFGLWTECVIEENVQTPLTRDEQIAANAAAFTEKLTSSNSQLNCQLLNKAVDIKQGLWRNCTLASSIKGLASAIQAHRNEDFFVCVSNTFWVQICGALIVVALGTAIIGSVLIIMGFSNKKKQENKQRYYGAATFSFLFGVVCCIVSLVMYPILLLQELEDRGRYEWYFGWSYGVGCGSCIFLFGAALLLILDRNKEEVFYQERLYLNEEDEEVNQEAKIKTFR